jgi:hypothetical protein
MRAVWDEQAADVDGRWASDWRELAPAAELLRDVWAARGLNYDKNTDGLAIASAMKPPDRLRSILEEILRGQAASQTNC